MCLKIEALTSSIKTRKQRIYTKNGKSTSILSPRLAPLTLSNLFVVELQLFCLVLGWFCLLMVFNVNGVVFWQNQLRSVPLQKDAHIGINKCLCEPSHKMFFFSDSNKGRHRIRRKLRQEKNALKLMIEEYNSLVPQKTMCFDTILETEHPWPWQIAQSGMHLSS